MNGPIEAIHKSLTNYFDALYFGDVALFRAIFHPRVRLFNAAGADQLVEMDLEEYLRLVGGRQPPSARHEPRTDEILSISVPTRTTAHARVREYLLPKHFTDELTFLFIDGHWKIISKVWHFDLVATT